MPVPVSIRRFLNRFTGFVLIVSFSLAGCNRRASTSSNVALSWMITPEPARVGRNEITLNLKDASSKPLTGARIRLEADMTHAGMAPVFDDAKETAPGKYEGALDLNMPGDWVVVVDLALADGGKLEREIRLDGVEVK
ncbi:MAG: FixH family protein [Acidobacteria bacterium]|nr:FixH family protein [Acidobacteriota bacterium]